MSGSGERIRARGAGGGSAEFGFDPVLDSPLLGGGLPAEADYHLQRAAECYHLSDVAETHLHDAARIAPDHAAVLIGLYRFYFYQARITDCLEVARACVAKAIRENQFEPDWRDIAADDADFSDWGALEVRFFLFSLKGYAYLNMRLGRMDEGRRALEKLLELDSLDRIGAGVLLRVLEDAEDDDVV